MSYCYSQNIFTFYSIVGASTASASLLKGAQIFFGSDSIGNRVSLWKKTTSTDNHQLFSYIHKGQAIGGTDSFFKRLAHLRDASICAVITIVALRLMIEEYQKVQCFYK